MNTYINDRKLMEYPFYNAGDTIPPIGCIKYLGVCLQDDYPSYPLYASAITISMDGVLVSLCRETDSEDGEIIGSVYAPASEGAVSMLLSGSDVTGSVSMQIDSSMLQNAYGSYSGKFYLDPSCVTYMNADVAGRIKEAKINGLTHTLTRSVNFTVMGDVLSMSDVSLSENRTQGSVLLIGSPDVNDYELADDVQLPVRCVESMYGSGSLTLTGQTNSYPEFYLESGSDSITLAPVEAPSGDLVVEITGGTKFPHCYANADESEIYNADIHE